MRLLVNINLVVIATWRSKTTDTWFDQTAVVGIRIQTIALMKIDKSINLLVNFSSRLDSPRYNAIKFFQMTTSTYSFFLIDFSYNI